MCVPAPWLQLGPEGAGPGAARARLYGSRAGALVSRWWLRRRPRPEGLGGPAGPDGAGAGMAAP